jgi:hypothetical protein
MKKGTKVSFSWQPPDAPTETGSGVVLTDEEDGHVLVACEPEPPDARHFVIRCAVTWLTEMAP